MLLNYGVGEDSWKSLGLQGDPTSTSYSRLVGVHWKDWCWSWNSNTLATRSKELTHLKRTDAGKDWGQEKKGMAEDEMLGWLHDTMDMGLGTLWQLVMDRKAWRSAVYGVAKSRTRLSENWTELIPECCSGFPYFLPFKSEFGNKEFMIWATLSSQSWFCFL